MLYLHSTIVQNLPSTSKDGRKHHNVYCHHYSHAPLHKPLLPHLVTVVQKQLSTVYHYSFNDNTAKAKHLYEVRDPPPATQNSRAYEDNYSNYSKKRKPSSHKSKSFKLSRQPIQGCLNAPLPICRLQQTPGLHIRHKYPAALVVNWITSQRSSTPTVIASMRILKNISITRT